MDLNQVTPPGDIAALERHIRARMREARQRLAGNANRTPVMRSRTLDARTGAQVFLKCENFQRCGAFKFRGAWHALSRLDAAQRQAGVLSFSSGNHAQALALAGRELGISVTVVMPADAPRIKLAATRGYGATVIEYDPGQTTREAVAAELQQQRPLTLIPPYDHPDVIAGQGTAALEFFEQCNGLDLLLVPTGGAGLLSGCALARHMAQPGCRVVGVEPELADDAARSFHSGTLQRVEHSQTIADGARTPSLGEYTFPLVLRNVDDLQTVSEDAIAEAVCFLFQRLKLVVEPAGALGLAGLLSGAVTAAPRTGVLLSGGNIDPALLGKLCGTQRE